MNVKNLRGDFAFLFLLITINLLPNFSVAATEDAIVLEPNTPTEYSAISCDPFVKTDTFKQQENLEFPMNRTGNLPSSYDLRTATPNFWYVSPIRDQGTDGTCWAFASVGAIESNLLKASGLKYNFSESNLKHATSLDAGEWGFNRTTNDGGNRDVVTAYLARLQGMVLEKDDPYVVGDASRPNSENKKPVSMYLDKAIYYPAPTSYYACLDANYLSTIKQAVLDNGAVAFSMYWDKNYYFDLNSCYNYNGTVNSTSHLVCIIGWDDQYSRYNFPESHRPISDGAFLVRNSWGTDFGESGYFHLSYEDKFAAVHATSFCMKAERPSYKNIYQYDPVGANNYFTFTNTTTNTPVTSLWYANVFQTKSTDNEYLSSVGIYNQNVGDVSYTVSISSGTDFASMTSISWKPVKSGTLSQPGYYNISIPNSPLIQSGKFIVNVRITVLSDIKARVPVEQRMSFAPNASAEAGQSYIKSNTGWTDATNYNSSANVCLKVFTVGDVEYTGNILSNTIRNGKAISYQVSCANQTTSAKSIVACIALYEDKKMIGCYAKPHTFTAVNEFSTLTGSFIPNISSDVNVNKLHAKLIVLNPSYAGIMRYCPNLIPFLP
ncbi:MAG: hypothetical protein H7Y41_03115 [Hyphomonadaceae bacterium]|nr:hypothetical protein [Clostridia bacterium]